VSVPFNDPFNSFYDQFSMHEADFTMPAHFNSYVPDNQNDYQCVNVIVPSVSKGATSWTMDGKWITLGIYRDEGRPATQRPARTGLSWTRSSRTITITDSAGHKLHTNDLVNVENINVPMFNVPVTIIDPYTFTIQGSVSGVTSGAAATYQDNFVTNFYESYRVFRLMPSFKLVPISLVLQIFDLTKPTPALTQTTMFNVTANETVRIPIGNSSDVNYQLPTATQSKHDLLPLLRRFGQVYDSNGQPLQLHYMSNGYPITVNNVDSIYKNKQVFYNVPVDNVSDPFIYAYDYYGLLMNDSSRGSTYSTSNVTINSAITTDVNNITVDPATGYTSTINDLFGNLAIGVQTNNALVVRKQILPLTLDAFNLPTKDPAA
jgi:hypothetical protein